MPLIDLRDQATRRSPEDLKMHGYNGYFGIDVNPERMPVDVTLKNSMDALRAANDRINGMDHAWVVEATMHPDSHRGWLEAYLIRQPSPNAAALPTLAEAVRSVIGHAKTKVG